MMVQYSIAVYVFEETSLVMSQVSMVEHQIANSSVFHEAIISIASVQGLLIFPMYDFCFQVLI